MNVRSHRCQPLEISNLEISFLTSTPPTEFSIMWHLPPPQRISHLIWPPIPLPPHPNFVEKPGSICQGLQLVEYSSNQTLTYIGVTRKKLSSFCLQWTTCITLENEARNCNTSIRSQMILEFWNIWHSNLSFLWAFWSKLLLSGSFGHLYRES